MKAKRVSRAGQPGPLFNFRAAVLVTLSPLLCAPANGDDSTHYQIAATPDTGIVALPSDYSQSDIINLRSQARGAGKAYVAYPRLILNGRPTAQMLPVQVYGEEIAIDTEMLAGHGIKIPGSNKEKWQSLTELGIAGRYDNNAQQITLLLPAEWLPHQSLSAGISTSRTPVSDGQGSLLNYDVYSTWLDNGSQSTSASHELRIFDDWGVASSSGVIRWNSELDDSGDYVRLDSYWRFTDPEKMQTWMVGDTISGALTWTPSVRLGGVQLSRNFAARPDLITFPLPQISGSATLPSALEVFVNDLRLTDQAVQPGPYVLETAPRVTGLGEAQIITTDTLGRQITQTVPFYVSPKLLKAGLWDYSASLGTPRRNFSRQSNDYDGQPLTTAVARYGMNDQYTLEASGSASKELFNTGIGLVARPGLWGVSNVALAHGQNTNDSGAQWVLGHEFRVHRYAISGQYTGRSEGYRDLSNTLDTQPSIENSFQLNGSLNLERNGSINASYLDTRYFNGEKSRFFVLGHSRTVAQQLSVNLSVNQNLDDSNDRTWLASFQYHFQPARSRPIQAGVRFEHNENYNETNTLLTLRQSVQDFWDTGWDLAYSPNTGGTRQAKGRWWTPYADLQAGVFGTDTETNSFASMSGSLVSNYEGLFAANTMNDSFAIVDTGGFANIPVRQGNRLIGHTNHKGRLLLPSLLAYQDNLLAIDVRDLPADVQITEDKLSLKPAELSGVTARFDVQRLNSVLLVVVDSHGEPIPAGARVLLPNAGATVVGFDGETYLEGVTEGRNEIGIISAGSLCTVTFTFTPAPGTLQRIGPLTCARPSENVDANQDDNKGVLPEANSDVTIKAESAIVEAEVSMVRSTTLTLLDNKGQPIPAGSRVITPNAGALTVETGGKVVLDNVEPGPNEIGIISNGSLCTVTFNSTASSNQQQELGPLTCLPPSERE